MAVNSTYVQGESIAVELTGAATASAAFFRFWPERSTALKDAAETMIGSVNQSVSIGEVSVSQKSASEMITLGAVLNRDIPATGGVVPLALDGSTWKATVDTAHLYGAYNYAIIKDVSGVKTAAQRGTFTVEGDSADAACSGGIQVIGSFFT